MPETYIRIIWPDSEEDTIYSPSSIIKTYFNPGSEMTLSSFKDTGIKALEHASRRVEEVYGYRCSSAAMSMDKIKVKAEQLSENTGIVKIISVE